MPLFLVCGISGVGKATVLGGVKAEIKNSPIYEFPAICTTREREKEEKNEQLETEQKVFQKEVTVTEEEFKATSDAGGYAFTWREKGLNFGLPRETLDWLEQGKKVLLAVPPQAVPEIQAAEGFAGYACTVLGITSSVEELAARKTPHDDQQKKMHKKLSKLLNDFRVNRAIEGFVEIDNSTTVDAAVQAALAAVGFDAALEIPPPDANDLKNCLPQDYLKRTVFPVLGPGLHLLDVMRPEDPIGFLAAYLYRTATTTRRKVEEMTERQRIRQELRAKVQAEYTLEGRI